MLAMKRNGFTGNFVTRLMKGEKDLTSGDGWGLNQLHQLVADFDFQRINQVHKGATGFFRGFAL